MTSGSMQLFHLFEVVSYVLQAGDLHLETYVVREMALPQLRMGRRITVNQCYHLKFPMLLLMVFILTSTFSFCSECQKHMHTPIFWEVF